MKTFGKRQKSIEEEKNFYENQSDTS